MTVGFIKVKRGGPVDDSDGEATVLPGTILYMEAFSAGKSI